MKELPALDDAITSRFGDCERKPRLELCRVLPLFKRNATFAEGPDTWRGGEGPLGVIVGRTPDPARLRPHDNCRYGRSPHSCSANFKAR
jgi:hypothetical protein